MFSIIGAVIFAFIVILNLLIILGLPLGEFTMGGKHKVLPKKLRIVALVSLLVQIFAIIIILQGGDILTMWFSPTVTKYICYFYAVFLGLNTIANFTSDSKKEKYTMTPLSLIVAICFFITGFNL